MKRILVVDDDAGTRDVLRFRLEANGYEVQEASNGVEAFVHAKGEKPSLIVLDVLMPIMDGYTFLHEARWDEDIKNVPIVVLSGRSETREIFEHENHIRFMEKPYDYQELLKMVSLIVKE